MAEQRQGLTGSRLEVFCVAAVIALLALFVVAIGSRGWLPALASRHGAGIDNMLTYLLVTTGAMLVIGNLILAYIVWRNSKREKISHRGSGPKVERNLAIGLGLLMTLVAEGGVVAIGLPVWVEYFATAPPADAMLVEVTGEQFAWTVRYPGPDGVLGRTDPGLIDSTHPLGLDLDDPAARDDVVAINNLYFPVGQPVRVRLRSKDVIHSFFLPHMRVKQDAVPGMTIDVWFVPTVEGSYELACTELCGLGHYRMRGFVHVVTPEEVERWLDENAPEETTEEDDFWT